MKAFHDSLHVCTCPTPCFLKPVVQFHNWINSITRSYQLSFCPILVCKGHISYKIKNSVLIWCSKHNRRKYILSLKRCPSHSMGYCYVVVSIDIFSVFLNKSLRTTISLQLLLCNDKFFLWGVINSSYTVNTEMIFKTPTIHHLPESFLYLPRISVTGHNSYCGCLWYVFFKCHILLSFTFLVGDADNDCLLCISREKKRLQDNTSPKAVAKIGLKSGCICNWVILDFFLLKRTVCRSHCARLICPTLLFPCSLPVWHILQS